MPVEPHRDPSRRPPLRSARARPRLRGWEVLLLAAALLPLLSPWVPIVPRPHDAPAPVLGAIEHPPTLSRSADRILPGTTGAAGALIHPESAARMILGPARNSTDGFAGGGVVRIHSTPYSPVTPARSAGAGRTPAAGAAPPPERPARPALSSGNFTGYVNDSVDGLGIPGVQVSIPACTLPTCRSVVTRSDGSFSIGCAIYDPNGTSWTIEASLRWWMTNDTAQRCGPSSTAPIGTIVLERTGVAYGTVEDQLGHPLAGIVVTGSTRGGGASAAPSNVTDASGKYRIAVPPGPGIVTFVPGGAAGYRSSFNYTDVGQGAGTRPGAPPWTGGADLGTIELSHPTRVKAELFDAVGNSSIPPNDAAMTGCNAWTGVCGFQGSLNNSNTIEAVVDPGPAYFIVDAVGFVESDTVTSFVPPEPLGKAFDLGPVWVTPLGAFHLKDALSEPAGGSIPWSPPSSSSGSVLAGVCSLDGFPTTFFVGSNVSSNLCVGEGCWNLGDVPTIYAPPLRDQIVVSPDTSGVCAPSGIPQWPMPSDLPPALANLTFVNLTSGRVLSSPDPVEVNLTLGDYVAGNVTIGGRPWAPSGCWFVSSSSTDGALPSLPDWNSCAASSSTWAPCSVFGSRSNVSFCVPVPFGNSRVRVDAPGYSANWTWIHTPQYCCKHGPKEAGYPAALAQASETKRTAIDLVADQGAVSGFAVWDGTGAPVLNGVVQVCPAPAMVRPSCLNGSVSDGAFYDVAAPVGPDEVTVFASGSSTNTVWVSVGPGQNVSAGTIPLPQPAVLSGQVVDPGGVGIPYASVQDCTVPLALACYYGGGAYLGAGFTDSNGYYEGTVEGGWLPWATYVVVASAPGYATDWTFANATSGVTTPVPSITLQPSSFTPLGHRSSASPHPGAGPAGPTSIWVTGRVVDRVSGRGVPIVGNSGISACRVDTGACGGIPDGTNTGGVFNGSVAPGGYYLLVNTPGYEVKTVFFNSTVASYIDFGTILVDPDPWVSGVAVIGPWPSLTVGDGQAAFHGFGPASSVTGCDTGLSTCRGGLPVGGDGRFNVTVPLRDSVAILGRPNPTIIPNSLPGGFEGNSTITTRSGPYSTLSGTNGFLTLDIFGPVAGRVLNNDSTNGSAGQRAYGLPYATLDLNETGPNPANASGIADGGGSWIFFLPGGDPAGAIRSSATSGQAYPEALSHPSGSLRSGGVVLDAGTQYDHRFGWVVTRFVAAGTGDPVPSARGSASFPDPRTGFVYHTTDLADTDGLLNLTTPDGRRVNLTASAPDMNFTTFLVSKVSGSATTFVNGTGYADLGAFALPSDGVIRSTSIQYSTGPPPLTTEPAPTIVDAKNGLGVPDALVSVFSSDPTLPVGGSYPSNHLGQFYSDAPIGYADGLLVRRAGFVSNQTSASIVAGQVLSYPSINLTGETLLAGRVVAAPGGAPLSGASIYACTATVPPEGCVQSMTNATGYFWIAAPPQLDNLSITADGFVTEIVPASGCPDCWVWVSTVTLPAQASISGTVRGLPSGFPVAGANVSICATNGYPTGPAAWTVTTTSTGQFVISGDPGSFILAVSASGYNSTYLPISLSPGEPVTVGTLFITQNGTLQGSVEDAVSKLPLTGATVLVCPEWSGPGCLAPQVTGADGGYTVAAGPGPYSISVSADQYLTATASARVQSALGTVVSTISLYPIGSGVAVTVSGRVVEAANGSIGIDGAVVSALVNGTSAASTVTDLGGQFTLGLGFGSYQLVAAAPGYESASVNLSVFSPISGLLLALPVRTFAVDGLVRDGLSHLPLRGAGIWSTVLVSGVPQPASQLTLSDPTGAFSLVLPEGTTTLEAIGPVGGAQAYRSVTFVVSPVANGPTEVEIDLTPPSVTVVVHAIDLLTGLPVPGISIGLAGRLPDGYSFDRTYTTGAGGSVTVSLFEGQYLATATGEGFHPLSRLLNATPPSLDTTFTLTPVTAGGTTASGPPTLLYVAGAAGAAVVLGAAVLYGVLRRRGPSEVPATDPPYEPGLGPEEPVAEPEPPSEY